MTILQQPVRQIGMLINSFSRASSCGERLFLVLDSAEYVGETRMLELKELGSLEFRNVSFHYPGENQPEVVKDISLEIQPGKLWNRWSPRLWQEHPSSTDSPLS